MRVWEKERRWWVEGRERRRGQVRAHPLELSLFSLLLDAGSRSFLPDSDLVPPTPSRKQFSSDFCSFRAEGQLLRMSSSRPASLFIEFAPNHIHRFHPPSPFISKTSVRSRWKERRIIHHSCVVSSYVSVSSKQSSSGEVERRPPSSSFPSLSVLSFHFPLSLFNFS